MPKVKEPDQCSTCKKLVLYPARLSAGLVLCVTCWRMFAAQVNERKAKRV